ncbi:MAG: hypothetical protein ACREID_09825, partial [Planctomycetota bacterium]
ALAAQGLHEDALTAYKDLLAEDEGNVPVREAIAALYLKLHEPKLAAAELVALARRAFAKRQFGPALKYYQSVVAADRGCTEAQQRIEQIESGRAREKQRARRRRVLMALGALAVALLGWQGAREWQAQLALRDVARATTSALVQDPSDAALIGAVERYALVCQDFPRTTAASHSREMLHVLLLDELRRLQVNTMGKPDKAGRWLKRLDAAESSLRALDEIPYPPELRRFWTDARDQVLERIAKARGISVGGDGG